MEIYFVTITVDQTAGQGKIFTEGNFPALPFPHVAEYCGCLGKSDGYWICAELDMSNKCDRVFLSTPLGGVSQTRQRRTNMASIREAVNTSRAAHYRPSQLLCHTRSGCVTSWRRNLKCGLLYHTERQICIKDVHETGRRDSGGSHQSEWRVPPPI